MNLIHIADRWKRFFLISSMIPIIFIGIIYIVYGKGFSLFFGNNNSLIYFGKFSLQSSLLDSNVELPIIVKLLGRSSMVLIKSLFSLWLIGHTITTYLKLANQVVSKVELILVLGFISMVYYFIISPSDTLFNIFGYSILVVNLLLIILYWIYDLMPKR